MSKKKSNLVFISYAREDASTAERLYMDLRKNDINVWLDSKILLPGQDWNLEIRSAIKSAAYFLVLVSERSVNKRGVVQREIRIALDVLNDIPPGDIFVVPIRLDETTPNHEKLNDLNWVDMHLSYKKGLARILFTLDDLEPEPLERRSTEQVGQRAPIGYTPFRSFADFVDDFIKKLPNATMFSDTEYAIYIQYKTDIDGVVLPDQLKLKYPKEIQIVLQHQYKELQSKDGLVSVQLAFNGVVESLKIPHNAIQHIAIPAIGVMLKKIV